MKKHLYIIRHGQTLFNLRRKIQGWCDSPLTELGKKQAIQAKELIKDIPFDHYYSSSSERCCDTMELLIDNVKYTRTKKLKEVNFGLFEGESEDLNPRWENGYSEVFPKYGGESSEEAALRINDAYRNIMDQDDHEYVLAVSHAGITMNFLVYNFGIEFVKDNLFKKEKFNNCAMIHLTYEDNKFEYIELMHISDKE